MFIFLSFCKYRLICFEFYDIRQALKLGYICNPPPQLHNPTFPIFLRFFLWAPLSHKLTCRARHPLLQQVSGHTTTFGGGFWPPQWSPHLHFWPIQPPSWQTSTLDSQFDLTTCGPHLEPHLKSVPIFSFKQVSMCLFLILLLILWTPCDFSGLFMFI